MATSSPSIFSVPSSPLDVAQRAEAQFAARVAACQGKEWSAYQNAIYAFAERPQKGKRLVIKAGAGSGKSTTGVELVKRVEGSHIFLAFNKPIQVELKGRGVNAFTFHGLCYGPVLRALNLNAVDKDKIHNRVRDTYSPEQFKRYGAFVKRLISLGRNAGIGCLIDDVEANWVALVDRHDLELEHSDSTVAEAIQLTRELLEWSNTAPIVDFDDLLYLAVKDGIRLPKFDNVLVDEGQDTNAIQIAVMRKLMHEHTNLYVLGDDSQAIYGFRGADSDALDNIVKAFDAERLPLTISYRCGRNIVEYARQYGEIEAAPNAIDGTVRTVTKFDKKLMDDMKAGDLIVCRCTRPLIEAAYALLKARKPAFVMGREIGEGFKSLINKMNARGIDRLIERLDDYTAREVEKSLAKGQDSKVAAVQEKTDCILFLIDSLPETNRTVPALLQLITDLFADKKEAVILATIHRSKGLESDRVFWLNYDYVCKWAKQAWQVQQETNLCYVAATRAKSELVLIPEPKRAA